MKELIIYNLNIYLEENGVDRIDLEMNEGDSNNH